MELTGGCHCGAVRYKVSSAPQHSALCHCADCRKNAGAPMVAWSAFAEAELTVTKGEPVTFNSSGTTFRSFCGTCGSGLFYRNENFLPGIVDIQSATFDDPEQVPPGAHIMAAHMLTWMETTHDLPRFEGFPPA